jgi:hypothetical protein
MYGKYFACNPAAITPTGPASFCNKGDTIEVIVQHYHSKRKKCKLRCLFVQT